ncbi:MAG TPA: ABC transporter substrate-binding protein [Caulobacter sp.]|nr:ABC transporter substrate-binding protein [Caulobacter sp.]
MPPSLTDRRRLGLGLVAAAVVAPGFAHAARSPQAEAFIATEGQKVLAMLGDRGLGEAARQARLTQSLDALADFQRISSFVLGRHARTLSPPQRQRFNAAFRSHVQRVFLRQLTAYRGSLLRVTGSTARSPTDVVVNTTVRGSSGDEAVNWRVLGAAGGFKVADVQARGVWLAITLQQDFVSTIDNAGGDVEALIRRLEAGKG